MAVSKESYTIVFVTTASEEDAARIGRAVVEERLAACANLVGPIRSIYRWREAVEDAPEHLLLIKTRARLFKAVEARVKELHPYEVAEIVAVDIGAGSPEYLGWIADSTVRPKEAMRTADRARPKRPPARR